MMAPCVALKFNMQLLSALGMWPYTWAQGLWVHTYFCYTFLIICIYLTFFSTVGLHIIHNWGSLDVVDSISVTLTNLTALTKLYMMLCSRERIQQLVTFIERGYSTVHESSAQVVAIKRDILARATRRTRTLTSFYCSLFVWTAIVWAFSPFTIPAIHMDERGDEDGDNTTVRVLPFRSWFPFDTQATPNYEIAYATQVVLSTAEALCIAAMDTFYMSLMIHTSSLFQVLRRSVSQVTEQATTAFEARRRWNRARLTPIQEVNETPSNDHWGQVVSVLGEDKRVEDTMRRCLVDYVIKHQSILKHCDHLEEFMSPIIFIEFLVVSFNLCLVGFQTTVMSMYSIRFVTMLGYMLCVLLQLFFLCLFGSELLEESTQVMEAVYDCKWYDCSQDFKRSVLIMIMRAKRPVKLTAGKFGTLTLETFNELIQTSYSYFAVLRKLHEDREF